jgi:hypothetical protein
MLSVAFHESEAEIPRTLWEACFPPPLEGRWWYETLETCGLDDQFTFLYATIENDGRPVGIAPCFTMDVDLRLVVPPLLWPLLAALGRVFRSLARPRILFVGSPCADEGTVGFEPGVDRAQALHSLQVALERKADELGAAMLVWKDFPQSCSGDLSRLARQCGLFPLASFPGTIAALPEAKKERYLASLKSSSRNKLKRKIKASVAHFAADVEIVQRPDPATLNELFALFWQTYERAETKFERLNRRVFESMAQHPVSHFLIVREKATREAVAFMLCFDMGGRVINKYIGLDYRRPKEWFLLFRLWDAAVDWAASRRATSIQSGQTGYSAKLLQGHRLVPLTNYCKHRNRFLHAICRAIARRVSWRTLDGDLAVYLKAHPSADASRVS